MAVPHIIQLNIRPRIISWGFYSKAQAVLQGVVFTGGGGRYKVERLLSLHEKMAQRAANMK